MAAEAGRPRRLAVPPGLPPTWADEIILEEVIRNLIDNAMRYSPPESPIELSARERSGVIEIAVTDHGPGVPSEERDRIFQSFHRLGDEDTTGKGYGLGLYFANKLLQAQRGSISVESPVWPDPAAPGARFVFTLPIATDESDDPEGPDGPGGGG
jgi:two-component system sensor histidine kinase KdpD